MKKLHIITSPREDMSKSTILSSFLSSLIEGEETILDLNKTKMPYLSNNLISYMYGYYEYDNLSPEEKEIANLQRELIEQLKNHDILIISTPMWNFGLPAQLKAYFDLITKCGDTYTKNNNILAGKVKNIKQVYLVGARGLLFEKAESTPYDFIDKHLEEMLSFIGITNIKKFWLEGANVLANEQIQGNIIKLKNEIKKSVLNTQQKK